MVIILSLLSGALLAGVVAYIERYYELKGVPPEMTYFTRSQLLYSIMFAFLAAQALTSIVLSIKLFEVGDTALLSVLIPGVLVLLKWPAESIMRWLMPTKP